MTGQLPQISHEIWDMKYRFKTADGTPIDATIEDTWRRIAGALAEVEAEPALWEDRFYRALEDFKFLPAGRITAGAGTGRAVTLFNCLAGETLIPTVEYGIVPISEIAGEVVHVLDGDGRWIESPINSFGDQPVAPVYLRGGYNGRERKVIRATAGHRWILENGTEVTTERLSAGHPLKQVRRKSLKGALDYKAGVRHGLIYGDGSYERTDSEGFRTFRIRLCGDKSYLSPWLTSEGASFTLPPSFDGDSLVRLVGCRTDLKALPESWAGEAYISGFLHGWLATDGCVSRSQPLLSCGATELEWLRRYGAIAGMEVSSARQLQDDTNYGNRKKALFNVHFHRATMIPEDFLLPKHRESFGETPNYPWVVESVGPYGDSEPVYCPRVVTTDSVQLDLGIHTGQCFVMGTIPDDMGGIFDGLKEAALTMQQGGGIGYDFSTLRPKGAEVKGVAADASGPLTFMDVWDAMCRTIMSAGSRRGAMMGTMRCDHPDVEDFIEAKKDPARLRMFNLSVLITDPFMDAVKADGPWELVFSGKVYKTLQARDLWNKIMRNTYDFAEPGVIFIDRINKANNLSYCETIAATNPCVPAGTQILTKQGWWAIDELVGREVETWNGIEWSPVTPAVTGRDQQLVTVKLSDGRELTCTLAHRFVLQDQTRRNASDLRVGDKLVSGRWPVIKGHVDYSLAYDQGFFSGDGTEKEDGRQFIYLYGEKKQLEEALAGPISRAEYPITGGYEGTDLTQTKVYLSYGKRMFLPKNFVPSADWDVESRLRWLEGICDSDGCAYRSYNSVLVQISAKNREFLHDIMLMLNTLGISSNLSEMKDCWRLGISASNVARLQDLGFAPKRLDISGNNPQREAARFARVISVEPVGEIADKVFCFTENRRHMGVFNGVLTGQCGEQPLPPYGACLLGSINMPTLVRKAFQSKAYLSLTALEDLVRLAVRMMDNVVDASRFPLPAQEVEARAKRRIGLGVTGLADALLMVGLRYGSPEAAAQTEKWMHAIARASYLASVDLAKEKGAFPLFDADAYLASGNMMQMDADVRDAIRTHGIRNALLTSIAPTGTISLYAGNVSSGIEPVFAYAYTRKVLQKDGSRTEEAVVDYAVRLWRQLKGETPLPDYFVNAQTLLPLDHVRMQAAAQKWIDSSISKTINCPEDISFDDFQQVYMAAWDQGCKGCTTYRPNAITGSVLSVTETPKKETIPPSVEIMSRPDALEGQTYKIKWPANEHAMYVTINDIVENGERRPFEVFINSKNMEHFAWTVALTRMISAVFRRPHDSRFVAEELKAVFDPKGGAWVEGKYIPSVLAAIGGVIERHMIAIGYIADIRPAMIDDGGHVIEVVNAPGGMVSEPRKGDEMCPKCFSGNVKHEAGCFQCIDCGHSKCG